MKIFTVCCLFLSFALQGRSQYYYKDLVVTPQTAAQARLFRENKVKSIKLNTFDGDGKPTEGFEGSQELSPDGLKITTHTHSIGSSNSWIFATYAPSGRQVKTLDTSDTYRSTTEYVYDDQGRLVLITNTSIETDNHIRDVEQHSWTYDANGRPATMIRVRNGRDSTFVSFIADEKGNIAEERARHNGSALPTVYYYYDDQGRLTDVVRYNIKAARLLPDYMFEYEGNTSRLSSTLIVPEGSSDYQKWTYTYDAKGLKTQDACTNRQKILVGRIDYQYTFK